jgi:hypothetical protein
VLLLGIVLAFAIVYVRLTRPDRPETGA